MTLNKPYRKNKNHLFMQVFIGMIAGLAFIYIAQAGYEAGQWLKNYW